MATAWLIARAELKRSWRPLSGLALIIAVVGAAVIASVVAADRSATSVDRLRAWASASDASFQSYDDDSAALLVEAARDLPDVEVSAERRLVNAFLVDNPLSDIAIMSDPSDDFGRAIDRPIVLDGRMPDARAGDEIMLNELAARLTGLRVGDHLRANSWSPDDLAALFETGSPGLNGPPLDLIVVGVGRFLDELPGDLQRTTPYALGSAAFIESHPGLGVWPGAVFVRVRDGEAGLDRVAAALGPIQYFESGDGPAGSYPPLDTAEQAYLGTAHRTVRTIAIGFLVFALAAAIAGGFVVGQAILRLLARADDTAATLDQLGMSPNGSAIALTIAPAIAGAIGVTVAAGAAIAVSPMLSTGLADRVEVDPGVTLALRFVIPVALCTAAAIALFSFGSARRSRRPVASSARRRPAGLVQAARRWGAGPTVVTGVQLATDRGRPPRSIPVRSTYVALAIGVAGVAGSSIVTASWQQLHDDPSEWGWNWSTMPDLFEERSPAEMEALQSRLNADDRLLAVGQLDSSQIIVNGLPISGTSVTPFVGDLSLTLDRGRLPSAPGEIALGERTMRELGVEIGDTVDAAKPDGGTRRFTVVGTAVFPKDQTTGVDIGALLTLDALSDIAAEPPSQSTLLTYPPDADVPALEASLTADYGFVFSAFSRPQPPASVTNLSIAGDIARALGWFFAVVGALSLLNTLIVSADRRSVHLAILRSLGFERPQVRRAVLAQAIVLATVALMVGLPTGWLLGRVIWSVVSNGSGAIAPPATPWVSLVMVIPAVFVTTLLVTWWPANASARQDPALRLAGTRD